mmetsp:Transcript_12608/g.22031  ORF Transcript_12608/g.22031 Transcript_12608/m.22031 type:complete len:211 (+) Transcript_12608:427-1059(+)
MVATAGAAWFTVFAVLAAAAVAGGWTSAIWAALGFCCSSCCWACCTKARCSAWVRCGCCWCCGAGAGTAGASCSFSLLWSAIRRRLLPATAAVLDTLSSPPSITGSRGNELSNSKRPNSGFCSMSWRKLASCARRSLFSRTNSEQASRRPEPLLLVLSSNKRPMLSREMVLMAAFSLSRRRSSIKYSLASKISAMRSLAHSVSIFRTVLV